MIMNVCTPLSSRFQVSQVSTRRSKTADKGFLISKVPRLYLTDHFFDGSDMRASCFSWWVSTNGVP